MSKFGIKNRNIVLTHALLLESMASAFLAKLLGIEDHKSTISFSNKSSSLSFNHKIGLLIDIGAINGRDKTKFKKFMEIRNQFMHNLDADSFSSCIELLDGTEKWLLRNYPQNEESSREEKLKSATMALGNDLLSISNTVLEKVLQKIRNDATDSIHKCSHEAALVALDKVESELNEFIQINLLEKKDVSVESLKQLGTTTREIFAKTWKKELDRLISENDK